MDSQTTVNGGVFVGGIAGSNAGEIVGCYNAGTIGPGNTDINGFGGIAGTMKDGGSITNCYNTGSVTGSWGVSGICGYVGSDGTATSITNCYNTGSLTVTGAPEATHGIVYRYNVTQSIADNSYYLASAESADGGKTAAQFASGEVAWLLNSEVGGNNPYGQTLGAGGQSAPVLGGTAVYGGYAFCYSTEYSYTNDSSAVSATQEHNYTKVAYNETTHWYACANGPCTANLASAAEAHSGGTATCTELAICSVCNQPYGDLAAHQLEKQNPVEPGCRVDGQIEHWSCSVCGKLFKDSAGMTEATKADVTRPAAHTVVFIPAAPPTSTQSGHIAYWFCSVCGRYYRDAALTQEISSADTVLAPHDTPSTGEDSSVGVWMVLMGTALVVFCGATAYRKKNGRSE